MSRDFSPATVSRPSKASNKARAVAQKPTPIEQKSTSFSRSLAFASGKREKRLYSKNPAVAEALAQIHGHKISPHFAIGRRLILDADSCRDNSRVPREQSLAELRTG